MISLKKIKSVADKAAEDKEVADKAAADRAKNEIAALPKAAADKVEKEKADKSKAAFDKTEKEKAVVKKVAEDKRLAIVDKATADKAEEVKLALEKAARDMAASQDVVIRPAKPVSSSPNSDQVAGDPAVTAARSSEDYVGSNLPKLSKNEHGSPVPGSSEAVVGSPHLHHKEASVRQSMELVTHDHEYNSPLSVKLSGLAGLSNSVEEVLSSLSHMGTSNSHVSSRSDISTLQDTSGQEDSHVTNMETDL